MTEKTGRPFAGIKPIKTKSTWQQHAIQIASTILIFGGLALLGLGIWIPTRNQLIAQQYQPPPLPVEALPASDFEPLPAAAGSSLSDNPLPAVDVSVQEDNPPPVVEPAAPTTATVQPTTALTTQPAIEADTADRGATATATPSPTIAVADVDTAPISVGSASDEDARPPLEPPTLPSSTPTLTPTAHPFPPAKLPPLRIAAPAIDLDAAVVEVGWEQIVVDGTFASVWDVAEYAAGWHKNSALPGHTGNIVLSGHHNVKGEVFRYIVDLKPGDSILLYTEAFTYPYRVEHKFIVKDKGEPEEVRQHNARWIGPFSDQRVTLVTCWPYNSNTHRVLVVAKPDLAALAGRTGE